VLRFCPCTPFSFFLPLWRFPPSGPVFLLQLCTNLRRIIGRRSLLLPSPPSSNFSSPFFSIQPCWIAKCAVRAFAIPSFSLPFFSFPLFFTSVLLPSFAGMLTMVVDRIRSCTFLAVLPSSSLFPPFFPPLLKIPPPQCCFFLDLSSQGADLVRFQKHQLQMTDMVNPTFPLPLPLFSPHALPSSLVKPNSSRKRQL